MGLVGILISYWIGYGTNFIGGTSAATQSDAAWRLPLALQLIPGLMLCVGCLFLPFSPRWLMLKGKSPHGTCKNITLILRQVERRSAC